MPSCCLASEGVMHPKWRPIPRELQKQDFQRCQILVPGEVESEHEHTIHHVTSERLLQVLYSTYFIVAQRVQSVGNVYRSQQEVAIEL